MKCKYAHCKHETKDIPKGQEIKNGTGYWHEDCLKESLAIREVIDIFTKDINSNVVMPQLRRTINNIVYDKGIEAEFLLFGLKYYVSHKIPLNYPGGLYYVLQNKDVQKEWDRVQTRNIKKEFVIEEDNNRKYEYKNTVDNDINKILC